MMSRTASRLVVATVAVLVAGSIWASSARAQTLRVQRLGNGMTISTYSVDPARYLDPYGIHQRNAYLLNLYGQAYSNVPPYALGYNPYGTYNLGPTFITQPAPVLRPPVYDPYGLHNPYGFQQRPRRFP